MLALHQAGGAVWAVPLWSERGLIGALLLGEKRDGGLYTQEEIEIARATGERCVRPAGNLSRADQDDEADCESGVLSDIGDPGSVAVPGRGGNFE